MLCPGYLTSLTLVLTLPYRIPTDIGGGVLKEGARKPFEGSFPQQQRATPRSHGGGEPGRRGTGQEDHGPEGQVPGEALCWEPQIHLRR